MPITIREAQDDEIEGLIPLLLEAEPLERALRWSLANLVDVVYRIDDAQKLIGVVSLQWRDEPAEIIDLAVHADRRGQGIGKKIIAWLLNEGRRRRKSEILVGTANSSVNNIAFYQKCGFRIDHVRKDYFWYYEDPLFEHGIRVRDMLVFRVDLHAEPFEAQQRLRVVASSHFKQTS
ncbi:MAG: GNAT family N-acetyltransferase, partial [Chloroflexota bacterium]